ncbi:plantaricin C family lantibiotic (plasmid) [Clostridium estertheticum]|uniref:Plantaricin C family lantibiotic n=1 Tax=Clostridium estertheticum TaxID=238834 RepID=A0AA47EN98_9CLOT|nr:plantaricin C family lantibiotic [Clostridium estertheticum]MBU3157718.1 plantaricin C family lantibiotic [Clostridium estertheticum]MBU3201977.1 plantaricin C family lantibiotic [Clostridium estertheticum]WAG63346.1 plantaricin C family lantibiotic [Clostridium estertheticum]WAG68216.1 plantaricin C family lantibiotic [Clostridium estertheticum]
MSNNSIVRAWKNPMYRSKLNQNVVNPAGNAMVELNELELDELTGAASSGAICTATTECTYFSAICC